MSGYIKMNVFVTSLGDKNIVTVSDDSQSPGKHTQITHWTISKETWEKIAELLASEVKDL